MAPPMFLLPKTVLEILTPYCDRNTVDAFLDRLVMNKQQSKPVYLDCVKGCRGYASDVFADGNVRRCLERILTESPSALVPGGSPVWMVYKAEASNRLVLGDLPQHTKLPRRHVNPAGLQFHRFLQSKAGHMEYYTVDYDFLLWERRGWQDSDKDLVALLMLSLLTCGLDTQQEIMANRRPDTAPVAKKALDSLHCIVRLCNQLRHGSFRGFIKKFNVDLAKVAGALDQVLFDTGRLVTEQHHGDAFDMASDELAWLVDRYQVSGTQAFPKATSLTPIWERMSVDFKVTYEQSHMSRAELAAALQGLSNARLQGSKHVADMETVREAVDGEKEHVLNLKDRLKSLNSQLSKKEASTDTQSQKRFQQAQAQVSKLEQEIARLKDPRHRDKNGEKEQLDKIQTSVDSLQKEHGELEKSRASLLEENQALQTKLKVLRKLVESLRGENQDPEQAIERERLEFERDELQKQADKLVVEEEDRVCYLRTLRGRAWGVLDDIGFNSMIAEMFAAPNSSMRTMQYGIVAAGALLVVMLVPLMPSLLALNAAKAEGPRAEG